MAKVVAIPRRRASRTAWLGRYLALVAQIEAGLEPLRRRRSILVGVRSGDAFRLPCMVRIRDTPPLHLRVGTENRVISE